MGSGKMPDQELLENLKSGTSMDMTIKAIYREYFNSLSWFVLNNNGSQEDAEDIFQEVVVNFIDLVQKNKFRGESSIKTFLFSLNRFTWLNELKRRGRALQREARYEKSRDIVEMDISQHIAGREAKSTVNALMEKLGEACRKILLMFYYEELSFREMLDKLEYENEQVLRNKKYKCLKQLEQMISTDPILKNNLKNLLHG